MRTAARRLVVLALSLSTVFAASLVERATITPVDRYIDVRFTQGLALAGDNLDPAILKKENVTLKVSGLGVVEVLKKEGTFRELRIIYDGDLPAASTSFEVCFGAVKFQGGAAQSNVCTSVFVPESYQKAYEEQKTRLTQQLFRGIATSKSEKPLEDVKVHMAVVDPHTASDAFGRRIGRRFLVFQVTIGNVNDDFDYLVHDVLLRIPFQLASATDEQSESLRKLSLCGPEDDCTAPQFAEMSSLELSILRGVAEKGQTTDPRNVMIRSFKGIGTIAAGLIGVTQLGRSYAPAVAGFNGPFVTSLESIFPDHTINQLNRLNDTAWLANRVVPRDHSIVMVGFVPQSLVLSNTDRKGYLKDSFAYLKQITRVSIRVTGDFVAEVGEVPPTITTIVFEDAGKFRDATPIVKGFIIGQFLADSELSLGAGGEGMTIEIDGTAKNDRIDFIIRADKPVVPRNLEFIVKKNKVTRKHAVPITYQTQRPVISKVNPPEAVQGAGETELTITGTDFLPAAVVDTDGLEKVGKETLTGSTELKIKVKVADTTEAKKYNVTVSTIGGRSDPKTFEVKPPAPTVKNLKPPEASQGAGDVEITITGENLTGATVSTDGLQKVGSEAVEPATIKLKVKVEAATAAKSYNFTVKTPGGTIVAPPFTVKP